MKKTLSILAVVLAFGCSLSYAADKNLYATKGSNESVTLGAVIAPGATLINTSTGKAVVYNNNDPLIEDSPFDINKGYIRKNYGLKDSKSNEVTLEDISVVEGQNLVIDFSTYHTGGAGMGGTNVTDSEYIVFLFNDSDFSEWYAKNPVTITGKFTDGSYVGYVITEACDKYDAFGLNPASTNGGIVFFNESVAPMVLSREVLVPEPATATLSLLALAGLAMRRRRRA